MRIICSDQTKLTKTMVSHWTASVLIVRPGTVVGTPPLAPTSVCTASAACNCTLGMSKSREATRHFQMFNFGQNQCQKLKIYFFLLSFLVLKKK